ncbi:MAG: hypothetical protein Q9220_006227 [cf. Caloplaca sp. 1 TL-2023]
MKLLVLGLPRTGTTSICAALELLGLRSYHWNEVLANKKNGHLQLWLKAIQAKYDGHGVPFQGDDFDQMLWDYDILTPASRTLQAVSDEPCCFFVEELIAAYPDAKVVLSMRSRDSWLRSVQNTILVVLSWRIACTVLSWFDKDFIAPWWALLNRDWSILSPEIPPHKAAAVPALLASFDRHLDHVRSAVPADRLLEFHPSQGWDPLCSFLGVAVPSTDFPHLNEPEALLQLRKEMYWVRWRVVVQNEIERPGLLGYILLGAVSALAVATYFAGG